MLGLILVAVFFVGLIFWTIFKPDFGLAYDITNPSNPFSIKGFGGRQAAPPEEPEPEFTFNETLALLVERGCAIVEGEPENLNPDRLVYLGQSAFIEAAEDRKLVFLSVDDEWSTLYVPVKEGHLAWRSPREPA